MTKQFILSKLESLLKGLAFFKETVINFYSKEETSNLKIFHSYSAKLEYKTFEYN